MAVLFLRSWTTQVRAGAVATGATGLEGTGYTTSGTAIASGTTNANSAWSVTGDIANGVSASQFLGTAYVVDSYTPANIGWVAEQSSGVWITAPGATEYAGSYPNNDSSNVNNGGIYLPGAGNSYASSGSGTYYQEGVYVYTLTFTITGSGSAGQAVSNFRLNLTAAADSSFSIYINPTESAGLPTSTAAYSSAISDGTSAQVLSIGYNAASADYKLGTNTIVFAVDNTDGITTASSNNETSESGLLVYGLGAVVPEVATWLPLAGALATYGAAVVLRRRRVTATR
jgi:hypothetical protein